MRYDIYIYIYIYVIRRLKVKYVVSSSNYNSSLNAAPGMTYKRREDIAPAFLNLNVR